jgi:ditrans,polycis-polyprenyl diphosphate synthase
VTVYTFSIENFKRPKEQVDKIMQLIQLFLESLSKRGGLLDQYGVLMRVLGRLDLLEPDVLKTIEHTTGRTSKYGDNRLNICISYTSRDEIATAIKQTVADCKIHTEAAPGANVPDIEPDSAISPHNITTETLTNHMFTADSPPVDILIRTSGAYRLSDFLLWQCHQDTQIVFLNTFWPDFGLWQFWSVIREWRRTKENLVNGREKVRKSNCITLNTH